MHIYIKFYCLMNLLYMTILGIGVHLSYLVDTMNIPQKVLFGEGRALGERKNLRICIGWN